MRLHFETNKCTFLWPVADATRRHNQVSLLLGNMHARDLEESAPERCGYVSMHLRRHFLLSSTATAVSWRDKFTGTLHQQISSLSTMSEHEYVK